MADFLEQDLPLGQRIGCWFHLKVCRDCSQYVRQYQQTIALGKQAFSNPDDPVPESVPEDLVNAALAHQRKTRLDD